LPAEGTVIPVICTSNGTHLTYFSGDKKAWPVYLTIGNIPSVTPNKPTNMAMIHVVLLPIPPTFTGGSSTDRHRREANRVIHCNVLRILFEGIRNAGMTGVRLACGDAQYRMCYPILCGWLADQPEHIQLHTLQQNTCQKCEVRPHFLGDLVSS
jgi:hypothetical protein